MSIAEGIGPAAEDTRLMCLAVYGLRSSASFLDCISQPVVLVAVDGMSGSTIVTLRCCTEPVYSTMYSTPPRRDVEFTLESERFDSVAVGAKYNDVVGGEVPKRWRYSMFVAIGLRPATTRTSLYGQPHRNPDPGAGAISHCRLGAAILEPQVRVAERFITPAAVTASSSRATIVVAAWRLAFRRNHIADTLQGEVIHNHHPYLLTIPRCHTGMPG